MFYLSKSLAGVEFLYFKKKKKKQSESGSKPCESINSRVFNMTLVSNVKKQFERVDSTPQIIGTRDDSRDTETISEDW